MMLLWRHNHDLVDDGREWENLTWSPAPHPAMFSCRLTAWTLPGLLHLCQHCIISIHCLMPWPASAWGISSPKHTAPGILNNLSSVYILEESRSREQVVAHLGESRLYRMLIRHSRGSAWHYGKAAGKPWKQVIDWGRNGGSLGIQSPGANLD